MTAPCGTLAAYKRHFRNKEPIDGPCREAGDEYNASRRKPARQIDTANRHCREMDEALAKRPPVITWSPNGRGVLVATSIDDPHAESRDLLRQSLPADSSLPDARRLREALASVRNPEHFRDRPLEMPQVRQHLEPP